MMFKKDKRKRKHSSDKNVKIKTFDSNDKYLAYTKKPCKKNADKFEKAESSIISTNNSDDTCEKKVKKRKFETENTNLEVIKIKSDSKSRVSISAKPKINEAAIKLNAALSKNQAIPKITTKNKKTKSGNKKSKKHHKQDNVSDNSSDMEIIIPSISIIPESSDNSVPSEAETKLSLGSDQSSALSESSPDSENFVVIIEANLKKSSSSYIPKALQDHEDIVKQHKSVVNESSSSSKKIKKKLIVSDVQDSNFSIKASKNSKENMKLNKNISEKLTGTNEQIENMSESNEMANKSVADSNISLATTQDENCDIPKALQEFYDNVTRGFEFLTEKLPKKSGKSAKKKSALTVDKSVTDPDNLVKIVHKNNSFLENSLATNQQNTAQLFSLENKVILVLWPQTQFSFLGKFKLKVLYGAIELYGSVFNFQNTIKPAEIYSPRGYSSISIKTFDLDGTYDKEVLWDSLTCEGVDRSLKTKLHDTIQECTPGWSVLLIENLENNLTNFLNNHCSFKLFPKIENLKHSWCDPKRAEYVLQANFQFYNSANEISIHPQWNEAVTKQLLSQWNDNKSLCAMITGGKGVGKSTTARYLINNFLRHTNKVVLLDLDPGQAELTPAACVSLNIVDEPLLGPNFTHLKTPFYQLYLEDINVANCITRYIECIKMLVECLKNKKNLRQYPIIINTMGYCKGIGLDICIFLIKLIEPSNVIQILSKRPRNNFDFALLKQTINEHKTSTISWDDDNKIFEKICDYELHYVPSLAEGKRQFETWNMEPRQQRELVLLSYLSQIIQNADNKSSCNFTSNSINNIIPYTLPFSAFYISLIKSSIPPTHILAAMNGNIVALCGIDLDDETSEAEKQSLNYPLVVIKPPSCTCYGYGIVRGIDMRRRCIYINTPLSLSMLRHVNLLAGCSTMPFSLLQSGERAPYAGDRGELPTSREARRGYFRIDQNKTS